MRANFRFGLGILGSSYENKISYFEGYPLNPPVKRCFFWESVSSHSWPFRRIQAFLLAALKNNVNLRALHDAARIFLFGKKILIGIGRVVCVLNRDVKVRKSDDIFFFR